MFLKTTEAFGGLSNMAGGFPLRVSGVYVPSSEALYQACRFPHLPDVQMIIIGEASPMTAKMKSKPYRDQSRPDWDRVKVAIMRWCLRVKLALHHRRFGALLLATEDRPIVEESRRDEYWGAKPKDDDSLVGMNVLGRLLMELREELKNDKSGALLRVEPLRIPNLLLINRSIGVIGAQSTEGRETLVVHTPPRKPSSTVNPKAVQVSFLDNPRIPNQNTHESATRPGVLPYDRYKEFAGTPIDTLPAHWRVLRLRNLVELRVSGIDKHSKNEEVPVRLCNYVDVYKNDRITDRLHFMKATAEQTEIDRFRLHSGDVVITKDSEGWNDIGVPALVDYAAEDLVCGYHLAILRPRQGRVHPNYLLYAIQSAPVAQQFHIAANGITRYGLSHSSIKSVWMPVPPINEQAQIARFLDYINSRIKRLILAKRRLIELLNKQKQAIIQQAVTRGLDSNVVLSPSDIPWLASLPSTWSSSTIKRLASKGRKTFTDGDWIETPYITTEGIRLIQTGNVGIGVYREKGFRYITEETFRALNCTAVEPRDVLICRLDGPVGRSCLAPDLGVGMITSVDNTILKTSRTAVPEYVVYVLSSPLWLSWVESLCRAGGGFRYRVSRTMLGYQKIPLPPRTEQNAIVNFIAEHTMGLDSAMARAKREISLLREYLARVTADVVTGRMDVRGVELPTIEAQEIIEPLSDGDAEEPEGAEELAAAEEGANAD